VAVGIGVVVGVGGTVIVAVGIAVGVLVGAGVAVAVGVGVGVAVGVGDSGWATAVDVAGGGAARQPASNKPSSKQVVISRITDCVFANTLWARLRRSLDQRE
jgi:hypothetical protein